MLTHDYLKTEVARRIKRIQAMMQEKDLGSLCFLTSDSGRKSGHWLTRRRCVALEVQTLGMRSHRYRIREVKEDL
jgi:hypothetical protein